MRVVLSQQANPSLETKETKVGSLWDDCSSHEAPLEVTVRSGLKHSPCNWAFTHNATWKSLWCYCCEWTCRVWARAGRFIFTEATVGVTLVICSSVHVHGRLKLSWLWMRISLSLQRSWLTSGFIKWAAVEPSHNSPQWLFLVSADRKWFGRQRGMTCDKSSQLESNWRHHSTVCTLIIRLPGHPHGQWLMWWSMF